VCHLGDLRARSPHRLLAFAGNAGDGIPLASLPLPASGDHRWRGSGPDPCRCLAGWDGIRHRTDQHLWSDRGDNRLNVGESRFPRERGRYPDREANSRRDSVCVGPLWTAHADWLGGRVAHRRSWPRPGLPAPAPIDSREVCAKPVQRHCRSPTV